MQCEGRTQAAYKNLQWSVIGIFYNLLFGLTSRKIFVLVLGKELVGLSSLLGNVIALISLLDMGASGAVIYKLYAPLSKDDFKQASLILSCYKKIAVASGFLSIFAGFLMLPFLPTVAKGFSDTKTLSVVYIIFIISSSAAFIFMPEKALLFADRKNYVAQRLAYGLGVPAVLVESVVLLVTKNYIIYTLVSAMFTVAEDYAIARYVRKKYKKISFSAKSTRVVARSLKKEMLACLPSSVSSTLLRTADNFLVTTLFGVSANGAYSNYNLLLSYAFMLSVTLATSITACVGSLGVSSTREHSERVYRACGMGIFFAVNICTCVLFVMSDDIIILWLGKELTLSAGVSSAVAASFLITGLRKSTAIFREALGLYKKERLKPFAELLAFVIAAWIFGKRYGICGVYLGQAISAFFVCLWYEPWVLYKYGFCAPVKPCYARLVKYMAVCTAGCFLSEWLCRLVPLFSARLVACIVVPSVIFFAAFGKAEELSDIFYAIKSFLSLATAQAHDKDGRLYP